MLCRSSSSSSGSSCLSSSEIRIQLLKKMKLLHLHQYDGICICLRGYIYPAEITCSRAHGENRNLCLSYKCPSDETSNFLGKFLLIIHSVLRRLYVSHRGLPERDWSRRLPVIICPTVTTTKRRKTDSNLGGTTTPA